MEATGVYYENIANYLFEKEYAVHVVLPNKAKKFAESLDIKSKTDKLDSKALGRLGAERKLSLWKPAEPIYKELKELTRERNKYIKIRTRIKNNIHALKHSLGPNKKSINRNNLLVKELDKLIKSTEKEMSEKLKTNQELSEKIEILTTIPGVGQTTAITVLAETDGFSQIQNSKQLCSYSGLDVQERESGKWKGQSKISKKGNSHIRAALYFPALTTIKYSEQHKVFYQRIKQKKVKSKIALTAVSRKLLVLMYSMCKNNIKYEQNYQKKKAA
jgi:transposase